MRFSVEIGIIPLLLVRSLFRSRSGEREAKRGPLNEVAEDVITFFIKFSLLAILFIGNLAFIFNIPTQFLQFAQSCVRCLPGSV